MIATVNEREIWAAGDVAYIIVMSSSNRILLLM